MGDISGVDTDTDGRGGGEELGRVEKGEKVYYVRKKMSQNPKVYRIKKI